MKKLRHLNKIIALIGVLTLINACASDMGVVKLYKGAPQSDSAVAKIQVPLDIDVVRIDNKAVSEPLLAGEYVELQVLPGTYMLSLKYDSIWDIDKEYYEKIRSEPVTKALTVYAGHVYRIEHDSPETLKSARAYVENFDFRVRDLGAKPNGTTGVIVATEAVRAPVSGMAEVPTAAPSTIGSATETDAVAPGQRNAGLLVPLEQLKYWWGQANDVERQGFRRWIGRP